MPIVTVTATQLLQAWEDGKVEWPPVLIAGSLYARKMPALGDTGPIIYKL